MAREHLPEVELYSIGPKEADYAAPLLTAEALSAIRSGDAFGMALVEEGEIRGAACARLLPENDAILELISLYVAPPFRRRALGGTLLMELLEGVMDATDGSVRWVTATFLPETEGIEKLLEKADFRMERDEHSAAWRIPVGSLPDSPLMTLSAPTPAGCTLFKLAEVPGYTVRRLLQELSRNGIADLTASEIGQALPEASYVLLNQTGLPKACAIVVKDGTNSVTLAQFFSAGGTASYAMAVLQAAGRAVAEQLPGDAMLAVPTLTDSSARLVQKLLPACQASYITRAVLEL